MLSIVIFGVKISISFYFLFFITFLLLIDKTGFFILGFFATIIHECGHLTVLRLLKLKCSFELRPGTVKIKNTNYLDNKRRCLVAFFGPIYNLIFSLFILVENRYFIVFGICNFLIGAFNLLPIRGLDGGDILECFLEKSNRGRTILTLISWITLVAVFFGGIYVLIFLRGNPSILIVGFYLLILNLSCKNL